MALRRALREVEEAAEAVRRAEWLIERRAEAPDEGPDAVRRAELAAELRAERRVAENARASTPSAWAAPRACAAASSATTPWPRPPTRAAAALDAVWGPPSRQRLAGLESEAERGAAGRRGDRGSAARVRAARRPSSRCGCGPPSSP